MAEPVRVTCSQCGAAFRVDCVVPGRLAACSKCGGALVLAGRARLVCDGCKRRTKPARVDLASATPCPKCGEPLRIHAVVDGEEGTAARARGGAVAAPIRAGPQPSQAAKARLDSEGATLQMGPPSQPAPAPHEEAPAPDGQTEKDSLALQPLAGEAAEGLRKATFGRYQIVSEIARGGMGIVYKAYDPTLRRNVALKVLRAGECATEETLKRFLLEARAAGQLQHPSVVSVHEVGEENGQHYFTMELVDGEDLADVFQSGTVGLKALLEHMRDICLAVQTAHQRGLIHRDLKPQNIMIDRDGRARVMDFGLAKDLTSESIQSMTGSVFGTPAYMSPEQARGRTGQIDHRTDVYSMGVILYEIVTGAPPFGGNTVFDTIQAVVTHEPVRPRELKTHVHRDLETIILKCMEKKPNNRYESMQELADDIERYLHGQPVAARALNPAVRLWRRVRMSPPALVTAVAVPAGLLAGVVVYWLVAGDFLGDMQAEVASGNPDRMASAVTLLDARMQEGGIQGPADRARALALARSVLGGVSPRAETMAMRLVARERDSAAVEPLLALAAQADLSAVRRAGAIETIAAVGPDATLETERVVERLAAVLAKDETGAVRMAAAKAMGPFWSPAGRRALQVAGNDGSVPVGVRVAAIEVLGARASLQSPAMKTLLRLQGDPDARVVAAVEAALGRSRQRETVFALYGIQSQVGRAMEQLGEVQKLHSERQRQMMEFSHEPLGERKREKPRDPLDAMVEGLRAGDPARSMGAAYDLGMLGKAGAVEPLVGCLTDDDAGVRHSAARALVKLSGQGISVDVASVLRLLTHRIAGVRENAAALLGELGAEEARAPLEKAAEHETHAPTRAVMEKALGQIGE